MTFLFLRKAHICGYLLTLSAGRKSGFLLLHCIIPTTFWLETMNQERLSVYEKRAINFHYSVPDIPVSKFATVALGFVGCFRWSFSNNFLKDFSIKIQIKCLLHLKTLVWDVSKLINHWTSVAAILSECPSLQTKQAGTVYLKLHITIVHKR